MNDKPTSFSPPRHWIGPEELNESYWSDPVRKEKLGQEFFEKPIEQIAKIDATDSQGFARRDFLTIMGASMALSTMACARRPVRKIIPYVQKPEGVIPGQPTYYASTCAETGEGVLIKNREGRPIKLEGNPDHPLNRGSLSARAQASLLSVYDPENLKKPLARVRSSGASIEGNWGEVDRQVISKLKDAQSKGGKVALLTGSRARKSPTLSRLMKEFLGSFSGSKLTSFDLTSDEAVALGQLDSYGQAVVPFYRFDKANVVVSFGADFMGVGSLSTAYQKAWSQKRKVEEKKLSKLYVVESMMSLTGSNADTRVPVRGGDEAKAALAVAHELIVAQKRTRFASDSAVTSALAPYAASKAAKDLGLKDAKVFSQIANDLYEARGQGVVIAGGALTQSGEGRALQVVVNLLNSALENDGSMVDGTKLAQAYQPSGVSALRELVADMNAGKVDVLIISGTNPMYSAPKSLGFEEAAKKVPFIVTLSISANESALVSDLVLPESHALESWGDYEAVPGVVSLVQPALAPLNESRSLGEALVAWAKKGSFGSGLLAQLSTSEEGQGYHDYLVANFKESVFKQAGSGASFETFWENSLRKGVVDLHGGSMPSGSSRSFRSSAMSAVSAVSKAESGLKLSMYEKVSMGDGSSANNAWLQEMPDPITRLTWDNYANVSKELADKLALGENDVIELTVGSTKIEMPSHVQPGLHAEAVTVAIGYGRRVSGKIGQETGIDVLPLVASKGNELQFSGQTVSVRKTGRQYRLASTQWHNVTENRPVINDVTLSEFLKNPATENHTNPHLRPKKMFSIWPTHEYKGYRWGMSIDLTACTGCGACVVACQSENNIPVVGRDQVRNSRHMAWIRIDRYYSGSAENPDVVFQPMICQHCENAPCETVCPVLATVHDDEGLNAMAYNRCVGTRYCQNNCPYKVRRFNFFDHWKSYTGTYNMVWNPEVTVRTRGVMEKCTFCVQRLHEGKWKAKEKGQKVQDGAIRTACQQTCPTDAIVFGDINDAESRVSKMKKLPRDFRVLEDLNTKPVVSYLTKVRNKESSEHGGAHGH